MADVGGYRAATVGTVVGVALLGGLPAGLLWWLVGCDENVGFECLGLALLASAVGIAGGAVGGMLGCYLALRRGRHVAAGATTWIMPVLVVPVASFLGLVTSVIDRMPTVATALNSLLALASLVTLPLLARRLALAWSGRRRSKSDGSSDILGTPL